MLEKIKMAWKAVGVVLTFLIAVATAPSKVALLTPLYSFFSQHWYHLWFRLSFAVVVSFLIYVFEIVNFFRPRVNVKLMPSGRASSDLVLRVTNLGSQGNFKANCEVVGSREAGAIPLHKTVNLKWEGVTVPQINIAAHGSESLLIASFDYYMPHNTSWVRLWGLDGQDKKQLTSSAWARVPNEKLPELDLKVSIFREGSIKPEISYYTVRPESYVGPLEMFALGSQPETVPA